MSGAHTGMLDRRGSPDLALALATLMLVVVGMLLIYSASAILALGRYGDSYHFIKSQLFFLGVGMAAGAVVLTQPLSALRRWATPAMALSLALLAMVLVPGLGRRVGGARRWLFGFQPSELAKLALVVFSAERVARAAEGADWLKECLLPVAGATGLACGLLILEPVDSIASTTRPLRFSRERISSSSLAGSCTQRTSSSETTCMASRRFSGRVPR